MCTGRQRRDHRSVVAACRDGQVSQCGGDAVRPSDYRTGRRLADGEGAYAVTTTEEVTRRYGIGRARYDCWSMRSKLDRPSRRTMILRTRDMCRLSSL